MEQLKANDIRIGNYIKHFHDETGFNTIQADAETILYFECENLTYYHEPIKLTVEWLEKFGFEEDTDGDYVLTICEGSELAIDLGADVVNIGFNMDWAEFRGILKYVHQLQNLFYCLSGGEELTIIENEQTNKQ